MRNKGFTPHHFWEKNSELTITLFKKSGEGFTLIELVISVFIIAVALSGAFTILQRVIVSTALSSSQLTASFLAQEGIEIVRNVRDKNWIEEHAWREGFDYCAPSTDKFCEADYSDGSLDQFPIGTEARFLKIDNRGFYNYDSGKNTKFKRKIYIDNLSGGPGDGFSVTVLVQWQDYGRDYKVSVQENLWDWYKQ